MTYKEDNPKKALFILTVTLFMILLSSCSGSVDSVDQNSQNALAYSQELDNLIPDLPASWIYSGTAEYNHVMSLSEVYETKSQKIYRVLGEVEDMSDGDSGADFNFELSYSIYNDSIVQSKKGKMIMDSDYDKLTIIKLPLEVGNTWMEKVIDSDEKVSTLTGTIENIETDNGTVYTVRYENSNSEYYEIRKIKENSGVIQFEKSIFYDGDAFPVQYSLYKLNRDETLIINSEESGSNETVKSPDLKDDATLIELDTIPELKPIETGVEPNEEESKDLTALIVDFNGAWTKFVNDKDMGILEFVTDDGEAYDIIHRFPAGTMILSFELIEVSEMVIDNRIANIHVHEIIKKVTPEKTEMLEYFWLYEVHKENDKWMIHSYVSE